MRAVYDDETVRVYQAYSDLIADKALLHGTFVSPPFSMNRMTWIKPSFLWMMYRSGWGLKDDGQKRILAIDIRRAGFDWALANGYPAAKRTPSLNLEAASSPDRAVVLFQWDPERDIHLRPMPYRSLQLGLRGEAVKRYVTDWIARIVDVTPVAHEIHERYRKDDDMLRAVALLPIERHYFVSSEVAERLGVSISCMDAFDFSTDSRAFEFCMRVVAKMTQQFGISNDEAIGRINAAWRTSEIIGDDFIYHEDPLYWANTIYFGKDSSWWLNPPGLKPLPYP